ncbi:hypothetical protein I5139_23290, partial [Escherichia coli]|nr:hypothetical protein [Escherichia coli]
FQLYVRDGVKAFDRAQKKITYHFDADTWTLNVAGWMYSKPDEKPIDAATEPVLK